MNELDKLLDPLEKWAKENNKQNSPAVALVILAKVNNENIQTKAGVLGDTGLGREVVETWLDDETQLGDFFRECYLDRLQKEVEGSNENAEGEA